MQWNVLLAFSPRFCEARYSNDGDDDRDEGEAKRISDDHSNDRS